MDAADSAAPAVSLPSSPMLQWARQVADAADASSLSNGSEPADSKSSGANIGPTLRQDRQADTSAAAMQGSTSKPAGSANPFAFDMGAFGMGSPAAEEHSSQRPVPQPEKAAPAANVDPFAFDMGAFGMGTMETTMPSAESQPTAATPQSARLPEIRPSQPAPNQAADPYAFDMGAFGMAGPSESSAIDVGQDSSAAATQEAAPEPGLHADPYAFDMGAFGMAAPSESSAIDVGQDSSAAATQEAAPEPGLHADPYAFDMGAFGMAGPSESSASMAPVQQQAMPKPAVQSDPYAFDQGASGMAGAASSLADDRSMQDTAAEPQHSSSAAHQSLQEDKRAHEHGETHETQETGHGKMVSKPAADPYAFDMGAFEPSARPETAQIDSSAFSIAATASHRQRAASAMEVKRVQQGSSAAPVRSGSMRHASSRQQRREHQGTSSSAAGILTLEPPQEEPFDPLTDSEMQQLEGLLLHAASMPDNRSSLGESHLEHPSCLARI